MATNDNSAKRENRVWLSCPKNLLPVQDKLLTLYEKEDIYAEGIRVLGEKHGFISPAGESEAGPRLEMDMHVQAPIRTTVKSPS